MLLDRVAAPQRPAAEACPRLIEGCIEPPGPPRLLEQPQLRGGGQFSEDHPQQAKFRTAVAREPARQQLCRYAGDRTRLAGRRRDRPLSREGDKVVPPDLHTDAAGHEAALAQAARRQVRQARELALQGAGIADIALEGVLGGERLFLDLRQYRPLSTPEARSRIKAV